MSPPRPWTDDMTPGVTSVRVGDLMRHALGQRSTPWRLAIVQRDLVWGPDRIARLLDSLLAGYPVGTLLLCRLRGSTAGVTYGLEGHHVVQQSRATWSLLDGQQRVNALASLLTNTDPEGRYLLDLAVEKPTEEEVVVDQKRKVAASGYIRHRNRIAEADGWATKLDARELHLDLSRFAGWVSADDARPLGALCGLAGRADRSSVVLGEVPGLLAKAIERARRADADTDRADLDFLTEVDPECRVSVTAGLTAGQLSRVRERVSRLLAVWFAEIPVEARELDSEFDVLQAFERINLGGVPVDREDVYFAAIKTRWPESDERLRAIAARTRHLLSRRDALRLLSRLASISEGRRDLVPLRVERLNPPQGDELRKRLAALTDPDSTPTTSLEGLSVALISRSGLGYGLRTIPSQVLDAVCAWVMVGRRDVVDGDDLAAISAYLIGATAFGYSSVLRETFWSLALATAIQAGLDGRGFPAGEIAVRARSLVRNSTRNRARIRSGEESERLGLVRDHWRLFLAIAQQLPYELPVRLRDGSPLTPGRRREIEWDHIWPQAKRGLFRIGHAYGSGSDRVGHAGNLWALDSPLNNYARDKLPKAKFEFLSSPTSVDSQPDRWPAAVNGLLTGEDIDELRAIQRLVEGSGRTPDGARKGVRRFGDFVDGRTLRIHAAVADDARFGDWRGYGMIDEETELEGPGPDLKLMAPNVADALELPPPVRHRKPSAPVVGDNRTLLLDRAEERGVRADFELLMDALPQWFRVTARRQISGEADHRYLTLSRNRTGWRGMILVYVTPEVGYVRVNPVLDSLRKVGVDAETVGRIVGTEPGSGAPLVAKLGALSAEIETALKLRAR